MREKAVVFSLKTVVFSLKCLLSWSLSKYPAWAMHLRFAWLKRAPPLVNKHRAHLCITHVFDGRPDGRRPLLFWIGRVANIDIYKSPNLLTLAIPGWLREKQGSWFRESLNTIENATFEYSLNGCYPTPPSLPSCKIIAFKSLVKFGNDFFCRPFFESFGLFWLYLS